jgi:uncharacterized protein YuzE
MKLHYYADTDSLYIDLSASPSTDSAEISDGFVADYDEEGRVVGLDIQHASELLDLSRIGTENFPVSIFE